MPSRTRAQSLSTPQSLFAWGAILLTWALTRAALAAAFQQPWFSPGSLLLLPLLGVTGWLAVEEPRLQAVGLGPWARGLLGLCLLGAGQTLVYAPAGGKGALFPLAAGLMAFGIVLVWPQGRGKRAAMLFAALMLPLGLNVWLRRTAVDWDLFQGPLHGQFSLIAFWALGAAAVVSLAWGAASIPNRLAAPPLSRRQEAWALLFILLLGGFLRFVHPGALPQGFWYDEVNLARVIQDRVLTVGQAPLYVGDQVENAGAWLWIGAALFKAFGVHIQVLRLAAGAFGLMAVLPFWALARLWLGSRWALVAALLFACMRWTLIPQRIAFMSGFALFWMLAAFWGLWWAWLRGQAWRWAVAGLLLGANLHTYTPGRFVPVVVVAFLALQGFPIFRSQAPRLRWRSLLAYAAGFLVTAGPMLWYIGGHWAEYSLRAGQVSLFTDVAKSGKPLLGELWGTTLKHLCMFNFRGDFNARHNLHFYPHVDLISACALALCAPMLLGQVWRDSRARFLVLWAGAMLCAGIFTLPVEAPQGHRTVLAAPALALALGLCLPPLLRPWRERFGGRWPQAFQALGLCLLLGAVTFNAYELLKLWPADPATFRSFSPRSSAVARRIALSQPGTLVYSSELPAEYQFNGFEWGVFARFTLRQQGRSWAALRPGIAVPPQCDGGATRSVLLLWGDSDQAVTEAFGQEFPGLSIERAADPYPSAGEPVDLYLAAELPYDRLPARPRSGAMPLVYRAETTEAH